MSARVSVHSPTRALAAVPEPRPSPPTSEQDKPVAYFYRSKSLLTRDRDLTAFVLYSSVSGTLGTIGQANYAASKAGLVGMARSLARELGSRNITVNVVAPGFADTDMTAVLTDEQKKAIVTSVPLGRTASADEVAGVVQFLAGPDAAYITGAVIPVDGGLGMGH